MRLHKTELVFLGYTALTAMATLLVFALKRTIDNQIDDGVPSVTALSDVSHLLLTAQIIMIAGLAMAVLSVYPSLRSALQEQRRLSAVTKDLTRKSESYQHAALTDPLTGLQNRRYFDDALEQYLVEFAAINCPLGIIMLDLDHFKPVNDTYGHDVGDDVLRTIAGCILDYTRHHDVVARVGGEEFAILAPNLDASALKKLSNRIRVAISQIIFQSEGGCFRVTTSMGITLWNGNESAGEFVKRADRNLYIAKTGGRNRVIA